MWRRISTIDVGARKYRKKPLTSRILRKNSGLFCITKKRQPKLIDVSSIYCFVKI